MSFGQFAATSQFYLYGRKHCTRTGWERAILSYTKPDILYEDLNLSERVYMITGANTGIGREISQYLASKQATVYMVCRSRGRGEQAQREIVSACGHSRVHLVIGDCSKESDVRSLWDEFLSHQRMINANDSNKGTAAGNNSSFARLDALICNAGALLNEKTFTDEGVEVTFAAHLLFGVYLLGKLAMPILEATTRLIQSAVAVPETSTLPVLNESSRLIVVSSGGMYNTKFPDWEAATSTGTEKYDGQFAYAYAKRGQVLLCERWAELNAERAKQGAGEVVKIVSCHPGWTASEGVDAAYGENKKYLEPLRTLWQGAEGIMYLAVCPASLIEGGAFYLDRSPQVKHMSGPFFTEGSYTKNTKEEVDFMMTQLETWSSASTRPSLESLEKERKKKLPLEPLSQNIDLKDITGDWFVLAFIPSSYDREASDCVEHYDLEGQTILTTFEYLSKASRDKQSTEISTLQMKSKMANSQCTHWKCAPLVWGFSVPLGMDSYIIGHNKEEISSGQPFDDYLIVSMPDRSALWIMTRSIPSVFTEIGVHVFDLYDLHNVQSGIDSMSQLMQQERRLLQRILPDMQDLGFDVHKVLRCPWTGLRKTPSS